MIYLFFCIYQPKHAIFAGSVLIPLNTGQCSPQVLDGTSCLVGAAVLIMCLSEMVVFRFIEQILQKLRADCNMVRGACSFESNKISLVCFCGFPSMDI